MWEKIKAIWAKVSKFAKWILYGLTLVLGFVAGFFVTRKIQSITVGTVNAGRTAFDKVPGHPDRIKVITVDGGRIIQLPKTEEGKQLVYNDIKTVGITQSTKEVKVEVYHNVTDRYPPANG